MDEEQKLTREEFAVTDLGHTEISLTAAKLFFIIFAVMIVTVPATHVIRHGRTVGSIFPVIEAAFKTNSLQEFNDTLKNGFHDYENAINETMPVREAFLKVNNVFASGQAIREASLTVITPDRTRLGNEPDAKTQPGFNPVLESTEFDYF